MYVKIKTDVKIRGTFFLGRTNEQTDGRTDGRNYTPYAQLLYMLIYIYIYKC